MSQIPLLYKPRKARSRTTSSIDVKAGVEVDYFSLARYNLPKWMIDYISDQAKVTKLSPDMILSWIIYKATFQEYPEYYNFVIPDTPKMQYSEVVANRILEIIAQHRRKGIFLNELFLLHPLIPCEPHVFFDAWRRILDSNLVEILTIGKKYPSQKVRLRIYGKRYRKNKILETRR